MKTRPKPINFKKKIDFKNQLLLMQLERILKNDG